MIARVAVLGVGRGGDRVLDYVVPEDLAGLMAPGSVVRVPLREREARGVVLALAERPSPGVDPRHLRAVRRTDGAPVPAALLAMVPWLADTTLAPVGTAAGALLPPPRPRVPALLAWRGPASTRPSAAERALAALFAAGPRGRAELLAAGASPAALARLRRTGAIVDVPAQPVPAPAEPPAPGPRLAPDQAFAAAALVDAVARRQGAFLLEGPTGSGKTEVYLEAIAAALARGRGAIALVPEIALTPQTVARFRARFGDRVAVLHSALADRERGEAWHRLADGSARVAVGARSAVWAPVPDLGVIVVDEEPESSYRGDRQPRYDARAVALERGRREGAAVVFGSATPSLEALHAADTGALVRLRLDARYGSRPMPVVHVADLRVERARPAGPGGLLTSPLAQALAACVDAGEQAVLLLNRRGYHPVCLCRDCGHALRCSQCDVSLTVHADRGLLCHYCGRASRMPAVCPSCRGTRLAGMGAGTQRLVEEVGTLVPRARVLRLDRDAVRRRGEAERVLDGFARREADVLIGTQMVAKGHDLPGVTLVGIVLADQGLRYPDLRAAERTAQLLVQAAGRAGRGDRPGQVWLQTYDPDHPAVRAARSHAYEDFAGDELPRRRELGYPPFGALVTATVSAAREERAVQAAQALADAAATVAGARVLGPAPPPVPRLDGEHRRQVLVRVATPDEARAAGRHLAAVDVGRQVRVDLDLDPA